MCNRDLLRFLRVLILYLLFPTNFENRIAIGIETRWEIRGNRLRSCYGIRSVLANGRTTAGAF